MVVVKTHKNVHSQRMNVPVSELLNTPDLKTKNKKLQHAAATVSVNHTILI